MGGRRPAGTRLGADPVSLSGPQQQAAASSSSSAGETQPQKGKKGLPFLKNPVSTLLMRRKANQNLVPDIKPLPLMTRLDEPQYDPRIKGTRVHDFSVPKWKRNVSSQDVSSTSQAPPEHGHEQLRSPYEPPELEQRHGYHSRARSNVSDSIRSASTGSDAPGNVETASNMQTERIRQDAYKKAIERKPLPGQPAAPTVPPKDASSLRSTPSTKSYTASEDVLSALPKANPSTRTTRSRKVSLSEASMKDGVASSLPKHMKSTSSRFSFDMIGAAKQEKLLEERHRQRQLEKKTVAEKSPKQTNRDSRFDDFDEDDIDYDAMMDDDGLEERIPGVNVDADEEDENGFVEEDVPIVDPDNDQQNFAGFVFQRSNPPSAVPTPHSAAAAMADTPRDASGNVIGFAVSEDMPQAERRTGVSVEAVGEVDKEAQGQSGDSGLGLGIQGVDVNVQQATAAQSDDATQNTRQETRKQQQLGMDDLYFDDGLADELDFETKDEPFDESLFDLDDTDQYGRPLPGVFARAVAQHKEAQNGSKRESDITSRLSAHSVVSQSTAHTSLSALGQNGQPANKEMPLPAPILGFPATEQEKVAAYQAALAAAAHRAAASGKFRRDSSPPPPDDVTVTSPAGTTTSPRGGDGDGGGLGGSAVDDYDDDDGLRRETVFDDYDMEDDAIIAEANASALANDSDGWYGQEFGFYSAPILGANGGLSGSSGHQANGSGGSGGAGNNANAPRYEYANGGYFGPAGLDAATINRTLSGCGGVVSREPNLTPITERSEYSNRNSIMSLGLPPLVGSGGGPAGPHSPGLAQLAMLAGMEGEDDPAASLSALMRLRTRQWGGSQASLVSSTGGGGGGGSPRSERGSGILMGTGHGAIHGGPVADGSSSPWWSGGGSAFLSLPPGAFVGAAQTQHGRRGSAYSLWSRDSDAGGGGGAGSGSGVGSGVAGEGSPTLAMAGLASQQQQPVSPPPAPPATSSPAMSPAPLFSSASPSSLSAPTTATITSATTTHVSSAGFPPVLEQEEPLADLPSSAPATAAAPEHKSDLKGAASADQLTVVRPPSAQDGQNQSSTVNTADGSEAAAAAASFDDDDDFLPSSSRPPSIPQRSSKRPGANNATSTAASSSFVPPYALSSPSATGGGTAAGTASGGSSSNNYHGHRHKGSADSISYVKEEMPAGEGDAAGAPRRTRWVMERRRTGEGGQIEWVEREVLEGGRI